MTLKFTPKQHRNLKSLSQIEVAKYLGISISGYQMKEQGKNDFTFSEMIMLSELYGCRIDEILSVYKPK